MPDKGIAVLAVDDNPDNLVTIKALVREAFPGADVFTAQTGQEGYELAVSRDPDVILLDIIMPGMNGFELCRMIKSNSKLSEIPVVFITAIKGDPQSRIEALECGAEAFLAKPIDESELTAQIRAMVKIKNANTAKRDEKLRLAALVEERTQELRQEHLKAIRLVKALKEENEIRKQSEAALLEAKNYFELMFNTSPDAACVTRLDDGTLLNVNEGFTKMFGYEREEAIGKSRLGLTLYQNAADHKKIARRLTGSGVCNGYELELRRRDGRIFTGLLSAKLIVLDGISYMSVNIHDISERKKMENNLFFLSYHDYLTGLFNRRYYELALKKLDTRSTVPLSVITGDINGVKLINDAFGQTRGDQMIKATANAVQSVCQKGDILARIGGDEFALLLPKTSSESALAKLEAIQIACETANRKVDNDAFRISIALGSGTKERAEQPIEIAIKTAERHMYQRKLLETKSMHSAVLSSIKATLYEKNEETEEHGERLIRFCDWIGKRLGLSQKQLDELELLSTLHDIGKIGIPERILNKAGKLDEEEWIEMKKHPQIGYRIANASPELASIAEYILCHHERWDGTGYPQRLSGEQIPLLSRILSVADAYDAMTQDRPYRKRMPRAAAIRELETNAGSQFDPGIVHVFLEYTVAEAE